MNACFGWGRQKKMDAYMTFTHVVWIKGCGGIKECSLHHQFNNFKQQNEKYENSCFII